MKALLCALSLTASVIALADDHSPSKKPLQERRVHETYVEEITFTNKRRDVAIVRTFTHNGERITEEHYSNYGQGLKHGLTRCWYPNGQTYWSSDFKHGEMHGPLLVYHPDGSAKRRAYFKNGQSRESQCFDETGESQTCDAFAKPATFVGTDKEFLTLLRQKLQEVGYVPDNTTRLVSIQGIVLDNGFLTGVVAFPADYDYTEQLRRALMRIPRWQPASVDGRPVPAHYNISLRLTGREVHINRPVR
jgi:hypothetical protein